MLPWITTISRGFRHCWQANSGHEVLPSPELTRELAELHKFLLNSLMTFLSVHLVAGSDTLAPLTLALLIYTITLHFTVSVSFHQKCPAVSRFLHAVPFIGIFTMALVELVINAQSSAVVMIGLLIGASPLLIMAIYHMKLCAEIASMHLPVQHEAASVAPNSTETVAASA